jgi:hypothetical protein
MVDMSHSLTIDCLSTNFKSVAVTLNAGDAGHSYSVVWDPLRDDSIPSINCEKVTDA